MAAKQNFICSLLPTTIQITCILSIFTLSQAYLFPQRNNSCPVDQYYDIASLNCKTCGSNQEKDKAGTYCVCKNGYKSIANTGGPPSSALRCAKCPSEYVSSDDRTDCIFCNRFTRPYDSSTQKCQSCSSNSISEIQFTNVTSNDINYEILPVYQCSDCGPGYQPNNQKCVRCNQYVLGLTSTCTCTCVSPTVCAEYGGVCFDKATITESTQDYQIKGIPTTNRIDSDYFKSNLIAAKTLCERNYNYTACQQLGNMCVMRQYEGRTINGPCKYYNDLATKLLASGNISNAIPDWPSSLPWLYYRTPVAPVAPVLSQTDISTEYSMRTSTIYTNKLPFSFAKYYANGSFAGLVSSPIPFQLCPDSQNRAQAAIQFGVSYSITCNLSPDTLRKSEMLFYDMSTILAQSVDLKDKQSFAPVPFLIRNYDAGSSSFPNEGTDETQWVLTRRFYIIDNLSSKNEKTGKLTLIRYPQTITLRITLQGRSNLGKIYPPLLIINYADIADESLTSSVQTTFSVTYVALDAEYESNINIACIVMACLVGVYSIIKMVGWRRRCGKFGVGGLENGPDESINSQTFTKFIALYLGYMANCLLLILSGTGIYYVMFFKGQDRAYLVLPSATGRTYFSMLFGIAFAFKALDVFYIIWTQTSIDVFFVDWEKPRGGNDNTENNRANIPISIWRTYFVANEWNEIQTIRKINNTFLIFAVLFMLDVVGLKNLATTNPSTGVTIGSDEYTGSASPILRFGVASVAFLVIAFALWIFNSFIYERFIEDKIAQFVDLCSMSNVSIFIMSHTHFGYYIHGKSVHGHADTDMKEMFEQLKREEQSLCGQRGLLSGSDIQTFQMAVPKRLRHQYDKIMTPLQEEADKSRAQRGRGPATAQANVLEIEDKIKAYKTINIFFSNFIEHSLRHLDYVVRDKLMLEKILDMEFNSPLEKGYFYNDEAHTFDRALFYGNEISLLAFDVLLFGLIDFHATNYILAGALVYVIDGLLVLLRDTWGRSNLARKTLVDERFLI